MFYLMLTSYFQFMFIFLQNLVIQHHWTILCHHRFATNLWCHWQYAHLIEWKTKQMGYVFYCKFYKMKRYHRIVVQTFVIVTNFFGMFMLVSQEELQMKDISKCQVYIVYFEHIDFVKTHCWYWRCANLTLPFLWCCISHLNKPT
jgi:hypothetical protein